MAAFGRKQPLAKLYTERLVLTQRRHSPIRYFATLCDQEQRLLRTKIVLLFLLIGIAGCGKNQDVGEREAYWTAEAEQFFQTPRDMADLHSWLREKRVFYTFEDKEIIDGQWVKGVEKIYVDGFVCESWTILLTITVNDEDEILTHDVGKLGTCL